jgi:membrane-bound lytic murein transglycosylase B
MGKRRSAHRHVSTVSWRRVNGRALRLAAFSFLLPVPVALAAPQSATLPDEQLVAMSQVPVNGVGDTVLPRVLPVEALEAASPEGDPAASLTHVRRKETKKVSPSAIADNGIPSAALRAYRAAEATMGLADPQCNLSWSLLAGIGRVESDHGRYAGAVLGRDGISAPAILGLPLNGVGPVAAIADTDNGALDGDRRWDRAVGPMQFIPSTWAIVGVDGDADGKRNPHDIDDAALAAAAYLCAGEGDLSTARGVHDAVFSYNHSDEYVALVTGVAKAYASGIVDLPLLTAPSVAPGPDVRVGLGNPGQGVMIGASDEVQNPRKSAQEPKKAGQRGKENAEKDRTGDGTRPLGKENGKENGAPTGRVGDSGDSGDDSTAPKGGGKKTGGSGDNSTEEDNTTPPAGGSTGGNGTSGPGGSGGTGSEEENETPETEEPVEEEPVEEPEGPVLSDDFATGTLVRCEDGESLCLDDPASDPLDIDSSYESLEGELVTVIYHSEDGVVTEILVEQGEVATHEHED